MTKTTSRVDGLNHLTLATGDVDRAVAFYRDVLGFRLRAAWPDGAYLEADALWLCLSRDPLARTEPHPDYTHVAFSVSTEAFESMAARVRASAREWKVDRSEGASIYFLDPDGHRLELHVGSLETRLAHYAANPPPGMRLYGLAGD